MIQRLCADKRAFLYITGSLIVGTEMKQCVETWPQRHDCDSELPTVIAEHFTQLLHVDVDVQ